MKRARMTFLTNTVISHSTPSILKHITKILASSSSSRYNLLYVLSPAPSLPDSQLSDLVTALTAVPNSVGCLSSSLPLRSREHASVCSLALFDQRKSTLFRSTIPGRKPTSVGRWHAVTSEQDDKSHVHARKSPQTSLDEIRGVERYVLPSDIRDLNPQDVNSVIYLSDNSPEGLSHSLSSSFLSSAQLGFLASPTPFLTGRPFTLFHNREIFSSGAVGVCLASAASRYTLDYPELDAITDLLAVTSSEGNLVHSLDNMNPAQLITSSMEKHNLSLSRDKTLYKEDQYYLGVLNGGKLHRLYQIMSGGPSRGIVSLEGDDSPPPGTRVRIYHLRSGFQRTDRAIEPGTQTNTLNFLNLHPESQDAAAFNISGQFANEDGDGSVILSNAFLAASEHGFMIRRQQPNEATESAWRFSVPCGSVCLS